MKNEKKKIIPCRHKILVCRNCKEDIENEFFPTDDGIFCTEDCVTSYYCTFSETIDTIQEYKDLIDEQDIYNYRLVNKTVFAKKMKESKLKQE